MEDETLKYLIADKMNEDGTKILIQWDDEC